MTIQNMSFYNNRGSSTINIFNSDTINWVCQLGHFKSPSGHTEYDNFNTCERSPCRKGVYGNTSDLTDLFCSGLCIGGHYCGQLATVNPVPCPPGTVFNNVGASDRSHCSDCFPGQYQEKEGQPSCTACPSGSFSAAYGSTACEACPTGAVADSTLASSSGRSDTLS